MLEACLQQFLSFANPKDDAYPWTYHYDGQKFAFHVVISGIIHGNEYGSLPALVEFIESLETQKIIFGGKLTIVLGNPEAARANVRFLESDLNRMFLPNDLYTHEANRARMLMPLFDTADLLVDFHQTILDTQKPFYICPLTQDVFWWAKAMACTNAIVDATPKNIEQATTRCADDYMYLQNKPAVTIELSKKGFDDNAKMITFVGCKNLLDTIERIHKGEVLEDIAEEKPDLSVYTTCHREPYHSRDYRLKPNLCNFTPVSKGEHLEAEGFQTLIAPFDGFILFPKYPQENEPLPNEIFRMIQRT